MSEQALSDVKVLDFTHHIAGPYCTKLLATYGADVIKVERPGVGDVSRRLGPFPGDVPHVEKSGLFLHLNTGKRSITLNLKTEEARKAVHELVADVDIVVESFRPGTMSRFGLGYDDLKAINPALVMTSVSNFGQTGPYRDYQGSEIVFYGMGGEMGSTGLEDREPVKLGGSVGLYQAGAMAAVATMGALFAARYQDIGQHVDVSIMETQLGTQDRRTSSLVGYQYTGENNPRVPLSTAGYPIGIYPCQDGYFDLLGGLVYFSRVVRMLGEPDFLRDPKWYTPTAQTDPDLKEEFEAYFLAWCMEHTRKEIWEIGQAASVLCAPVNTVEDVINDPVLAERGSFDRLRHPEVGEVKITGRPFIMTETPWQIRRPPPLLGEHNEEVLASLGYGKMDVARLKSEGVI
ncbi:MAG: CoA transferase [Dehalococcoidia bacterium]|nr:CoA transferase [Dehalococcoidia bacterium]